MIMPFEYFFGINFTLNKNKYFIVVFFLLIYSYLLLSYMWSDNHRKTMWKVILYFMIYCMFFLYLHFYLLFIEILIINVVPHRHTNVYLLLVVILDFGCVHWVRETEINIQSKAHLRLFVCSFFNDDIRIVNWKF
jgi:hypothetical protein